MLGILPRQQLKSLLIPDPIPTGRVTSVYERVYPICRLEHVGNLLQAYALGGPAQQNDKCLNMAL